LIYIYIHFSSRGRRIQNGRL